jgi:hypothetical protein
MAFGFDHARAGEKFQKLPGYEVLNTAQLFI